MNDSSTPETPRDDAMTPSTMNHEDDFESLFTHPSSQQGKTSRPIPSEARQRPTNNKERLQETSFQMLENMLLQQQTQSTLLQTQLDAALLQNHQLKRMMEEERRVTLDRYQALRRMVLQHLSQKGGAQPSRQVLENNQSLSNSTSTGSSGISQPSYEANNPSKLVHNHVDRCLVTSSEESASETVPTASLLLSPPTENQNKPMDCSGSYECPQNVRGHDYYRDSYGYPELGEYSMFPSPLYPNQLASEQEVMLGLSRLHGYSQPNTHQETSKHFQYLQ